MSTHELTDKIRQLKELHALIDEANSEAEAIKDELKVLMLERKTDEMSVDVFKVRYVEIKSNRFDSAEFKKTHADLYRQYTKQVTTRRFSVA